MKKQQKLFSKWTARDILNYWYEIYSKHNNESYSHGDFIGKELKIFRELLDSHDVYSILLAIEKGIQNGETLIKYFNINIDKYAPETIYSKYFFIIDKFGPVELREKLLSLSTYETQWIPSATTNQKISDLVKLFDEWIVKNNYDT